MLERVEQPQLQVILPKENEEQIYQIYLTIARKVVDDVTKNITVNRRYLNKKQLAKYFQCSPLVIDDWVKNGLKSFNKGREIMFDMHDVEEYLETIKN
ncbi:helix-turn-helix domain-containing protein [Globicatella sp. PHS-GS-PNBC-21-1553]|uniref:helix-turn-helix domain-containing protein n=1 Tax=Globicatella sp. PHS-GS-PNBC-21-1553 TaxID=2885764 RepID=UPI00298ED12B|nr:helix-turn-helix domain-containing protein [Globicatella sp. PHS-GS-PNBC-21-1553]WPC08808.1 helix-turn-helix domain-containing protein [Globicatella sp. PHS-GS-PNBC-21-1553]